MVQYVQSIRFRVCGNIIDCHVGGAELDGVECTTVAWRVHEANIIWCGLSVCVCVCVCVCAWLCFGGRFAGGGYVCCHVLNAAKYFASHTEMTAMVLPSASSTTVYGAITSPREESFISWKLARVGLGTSVFAACTFRM